MELHWPHASSGKHGAAGEGFSIGDSKTITRILERRPEDDFECTYFRQRPKRTPTKEFIQQTNNSGGLFPMTIDYNTLTSELSDAYTDSESESDNTSNVERWLESLPANDAWSSTPNYLALDGSVGLEGVDEIQEDSKKILDDDLKASPTSTRDSKKSLISKAEDSKARADGNKHAKRTFTRRDEIYATSEWIDRQTPHKKMERTLKMRKKIPLWTEVERKAKIVIAKENFSERRASGEAETCSLISESNGVPIRNVSIYDRVVCSYLETTERKRSAKTLSYGEDAYNEMMQEMVHGLLSASACSEDESTRDRMVEKSEKETKFPRINESRETIDGSRLQVGIKRTRLSSTSKNLSPKLAKTKINENHLSKRKRVQALKTVTKKAQRQNPKRVRKISQRRKFPVSMNQQVKPAEKLRCAIKNLPSVEDTESDKTAKRLKCFPQPRTVRFQDEVTVETSTEAWRRSAMAKAARNKQILQTVEQIVDNIGAEEEDKTCGHPGEAQRAFSSISGIEDCEDSDELTICCGSWRSNRKRPMNSIENKTIGSRKPLFTNPFVENCLDNAMDVALSKYKWPKNTWEDLVKEQTREKRRSAAYEPPAKKMKPKSFTTRTENVPRQDLSLLNSWQSIHNHFLLYSSCK